MMAAMLQIEPGAVFVREEEYAASAPVGLLIWRLVELEDKLRSPLLTITRPYYFRWQRQRSDRLGCGVKATCWSED